MKTLKARTSHPRKKILKISDLTYNKHYTKYTPSDVRTALKRAWQNGGDVLRYSIML